MMNVQWTPDASKQAEEVLQYSEVHFGMKAARRIATKIEANNGLLASNPLLGPLEPNLSNRAKKYRHLIIDTNYKMIYYIDCDTVYIAGLWHRSLNPKRMDSLF